MLIVKKCVLRGRPQGGRAVFIVILIIIDSASNKDSNGGLIVIVDSGLNPNLKCRFGAQYSDSRGRFS